MLADGVSVDIELNKRIDSPLMGKKDTNMSREFSRSGAHYLEESEQLRYAREFIDSGRVSIHLQPKFNSPEIRGKIEAAILTNVWLLPDPNINNDLALRGSVSSKMSPATLLYDSMIDGFDIRVDIVAKASRRPESKPGIKEETLLEEALKRGINVVEPLGSIDTLDPGPKSSILLTVLKHGLVPLSSINFSSGFGNVAVQQRLERVLQRAGAFVGDGQNKGLAHGDLHGGNIAMDVQLDRKHEFIFFDLENARFSDGSLKTETAFTKDLALLVSSIQLANPTVPAEIIANNILAGYFSVRANQTGLRTKTEFMDIFEHSRKRFLEQQQRLTTSNSPPSLQLSPVTEQR